MWPTGIDGWRGDGAAQHRLPPLPSPNDNAAMEAEPPVPAPPKPNRRRFQFRLRTLMIGITLFALIPCGYIGWQAKIVRDRQAWTAHLAARGFVPRIGDVVIRPGDLE